MSTSKTPESKLPQTNSPDADVASTCTTQSCCRMGGIARIVGVIAVLALIAVVVYQFVGGNATSASSLTEKLDNSRAAAQSSVEAAKTTAATTTETTANSHPLDAALDLARDGLRRIEDEVTDYTARIIKRERVGDKLGEEQQMAAKIRCRKKEGDELVQPFAVYLKFVEPKSIKGREVIWAEGKNDGKLIAHEGGLLNVVRAPLNPDGPLAMMGQRYPIYKIGIQNLVEELIIKGERDKQLGTCKVTMTEREEVAGRTCQLLEVRHDDRRPEFDFHIARIWIDEELQLPIRYAAWSWPESPGGEPVLLEDYTYADLKVNVGLTDADFDPDNSEYDYP